MPARIAHENYFQFNVSGAGCQAPFTPLSAAAHNDIRLNAEQFEVGYLSPAHLRADAQRLVEGEEARMNRIGQAKGAFTPLPNRPGAPTTTLYQAKGAPHPLSNRPKAPSTRSRAVCEVPICRD